MSCTKRLVLIFIVGLVNSVTGQLDCDNPNLSIKSRNLCLKQLNASLATSTTEEAMPTAATPSSTAREYSSTPVPYYVTTTLDPFDQEDIDDMEGFGEVSCENLSQADIEAGVLCEEPEDPIIRWRDPVFEKLIKQVWHDTQVKINRESSLYGFDLAPLRVDELLPGGRVDEHQESGMYEVDIEMWNMQVHGLDGINMSQVLVTRAQDLSDFEMEITFSFDEIVANGTYTIKGWAGWFEIDSGGAQPFSVEIVNATLSPTIKLDTTRDYRFGCGTEDGVIISDIGFPLKYDDITFNFENLGAFFNTVVNGVGVYLIESNQQAIVNKVKSEIKKHANSLIC